MPDPVTYKVVDHGWSPSEPTGSEADLNAQGQQGWQLSTVYPDRQRERTRWVFSQGGIGPVHYKVVDQPWSPSEPSVAEDMLNQMGQDGWALSTAYPDPQRERTRWIFGQGPAATGGGGGGIPEAPLDGVIYGRQNATWTSASVPGPTGPAGPPGVDGNTGPVGPAGPAGDPGQDGAPGPAGPTGAQGPTGTSGVPGPPGAVGATGATGATGAAGPQGPIGLTGNTGPAGPTGATGTTGATGPQGNAGPTGPAGKDGAAGPAGPTGATGPTGLQGPQGLVGPQGALGPQGPAGPSAVSTDTGNLAKLGTDSLVYVPNTGPIKGTVAADQAAPGNVGEQLSASIATAVNLTLNTAINIGQLTLTPGDWVVGGNVNFVSPATAGTRYAVAISPTSGTLPTPAQLAIGTGTLLDMSWTFGKAAQNFNTSLCRVNISTNTTIYLVALGPATTATGYISARRVR